MTPKEKAIEIAKQYWKALGEQNYPTSINCAIIHVKGIIDCLGRLDFSLEIDDEVKYWQEVLHELNQM